MSDKWGKRSFWVLVVIAVICLANAYSAFGVRSRLDARDMAWQSRINALESDMAVIKKAKLAQDDFNARVIKILEKKQ